MLDIVDTAGQEEYNTLRDEYITTADGFILVFSLTERSTMGDLKPLHNQIRLVNNHAAIVLVANKLDIVTHYPTKRVVSIGELQKTASEWGVSYFETSAKDGTNVAESWHALVRLVRQASTKLNSNGVSTFSNKIPMKDLDEKRKSHGCTMC